MRRLSRVGVAARLAPARRDWVEAVWAEAREVPPGLRRMAWRAGGMRLLAGETLMGRGMGRATLFAAAGLAVWGAWPGPPGSFATSVARADVITMVPLLAGLALVARRFFGSSANSRAARFLRVGTCAAILVLIAAKAAIVQFAFAPPHGGVELRLYRLINVEGFGDSWRPEILFLGVMALYAVAILWMTSGRSQVAPATLAIGTGAGIVLGAVMYAVAPLGLVAATNPWLPGFNPFVVLAWILLFGAASLPGFTGDRPDRAAAALPRAS